MPIIDDESDALLRNLRSNAAKQAERVTVGAGWNPVTEATFDTGVIAIGHDRSLCVWVEDED